MMATPWRAYSRFVGLTLGIAPSLVGCVGSAVDDSTLFVGLPIEIESERGGVSAQIACEAGRVVRGDNVLLVELSDADAVVLDASAAMPAHGHASDSPAIEEDADGYRVEDLLLYMPGRWDVMLDLDLPSGRDRLLFGMEVP
jgi:hypothetical protein